MSETFSDDSPLSEDATLYAHTLARALDAYAARRVAEAQAWRPIETAPKDGTALILARFGWWNDTGDAEAGTKEWRARIWDNTRRVYGLFWISKGHWSEKWRNWNDGTEPSGLNRPTHWQPLPESPKTEDAT